jgi:hypothetical protein
MTAEESVPRHSRRALILTFWCTSAKFSSKWRTDDSRQAMRHDSDRNANINDDPVNDRTFPRLKTASASRPSARHGAGATGSVHVIQSVPFTRTLDLFCTHYLVFTHVLLVLCHLDTPFYVRHTCIPHLLCIACPPTHDASMHHFAYVPALPLTSCTPTNQPVPTACTHLCTTYMLCIINGDSK